MKSSESNEELIVEPNKDTDVQPAPEKNTEFREYFMSKTDQNQNQNSQNPTNKNLKDTESHKSSKHLNSEAEDSASEVSEDDQAQQMLPQLEDNLALTPTLEKYEVAQVDEDEDDDDDEDDIGIGAKLLDIFQEKNKPIGEEKEDKEDVDDLFDGGEVGSDEEVELDMDL
eukprot:CAMPEP_0205829268 /NCGR_PEP_ID=MMETSP0206-20130828/37563_1 /ASSEMBLY_ACC=CAM_ASM_000279 /TAXON_ID=36767 /ORGANISM="Euplotes focardii, Strain TN1" /LENGTH=169 /DNA_ID=CAMNT_0053131815 /DNA_START=149 /DNA_END=655 /DNA_ORIENTATION=-